MIQSPQSVNIACMYTVFKSTRNRLLGLDMIQNPHSAGSWLMVEVVANIRLTGRDIVPNPHIIGSWLLMEVVCHGDTHTHTHTHTHAHQAFLICLPLARRCSQLYIINGALGESNIGPGHMETRNCCKMLFINMYKESYR